MKTNSKVILAVDDDPKILKAIELRLTSRGFTVLTASNGHDAFVMAEMKKPDLIIADIWMPVGMGFSLAYKLKQSMHEIPLILMTASKQPGLKGKARDMGAAGFLEKPYEPEMLLQTISEVLAAPAAFGSSDRVAEAETEEDTTLAQK